VLEAVGVTPSDEAVYRQLLRHPHATTAELADLVCRDATSVRRTIGRLEQLGMVTRVPGNPPHLLTTRPDIAVEVLVARRREELSRAQLAAQELLGEVVVDEERRADRLVEVVVGLDAVAAQFAQLLKGVERELLIFDRPPYVQMPERSYVAVRSLLDKGVSVRGVYAPESLELPGALEEAQVAAAAGEQSRVHPDLPMKLAIADGKVALLPLSGDIVVSNALLIHPCALLDATHALFELLWTSAVPVFDAAASTQADPLSAEHDTLLTALAAGLKDDTIARQVGTSTRTVRRRIAELNDALRARTRFQAGVLAERQGLLRRGGGVSDD